MLSLHTLTVILQRLIPMPPQLKEYNALLYVLSSERIAFSM